MKKQIEYSPGSEVRPRTMCWSLPQMFVVTTCTQWAVDVYVSVVTDAAKRERARVSSYNTRDERRKW